MFFGAMLLIFLITAALVVTFDNNQSVRVDTFLGVIYDVLKFGSGLFFGLLAGKGIDLMASVPTQAHPLPASDPGIRE